MADLNSQHSIEQAEFEAVITGAVVTAEQKADLEQFIQFDLTRVIDEVFDAIQRTSAQRVTSLTIERLEIDLGDFSLQDYRQQMPLRLRRQLWQALNDACHTRPRSTTTESADTSNADISGALFSYLRQGYLSGNASLADAKTLESQLQQILATRPNDLIGFIRGSTRTDVIIKRLNAQFPASLCARIARLLENTKATASIEQRLLNVPGLGRDERFDVATLTANRKKQPQDGERQGKIEDRCAQFKEQLLTGSQVEFDQLWQRLLRETPESLAHMLRQIGRRGLQRQQLLHRLSIKQFAELVQLLEPVSHELLLSLLEPGHWLEYFSCQLAAGAKRNRIELRGYLLGYLLVERGARFDPRDLVDSLFEQMLVQRNVHRVESWPLLIASLKSRARTDDRKGELARLMLDRVERQAEQPRQSWVEAYQCHARLEAVFSLAARVTAEGRLLADIDALEQRAPWLLLRLLRQLQGVNRDWRYPLQQHSAVLLQRLCISFLKLISQTVATAATPASAELIAAIGRHATCAADPQIYFADVLARIVRGDHIDFDAIDNATGEAANGSGSDRSDDMNRVTNAGVCGADSGNSLATAGSVYGEDFASADGVEQPGDEVDWIGGILSPMRGRAVPLLQCAELLSTACLSLNVALSPGQLDAIKWQLLKNCVSDTGALYNPEYILRDYLALVMAQAAIEDTGEFYRLIAQALLKNSLPATRELTRDLLALLTDIAAQSGSARGQQGTAVDVDTTVVQHPEFEEIPSGENIHIANAGLVLLAPWLPRLFSHLGFVEDGEFKDRDTAERAVHCLQFLVDASVDSPEYQLPLNKLLCGVRPGKPIRRGIELSPGETEQLESLLLAITEHWKALRNTSIDGLRESFLQRGGRLQLDGDAWHLTVEARAYDMLLEQVPWSYSTIRLAWMERVIYVDWC